jgi:hypothetical protein
MADWIKKIRARVNRLLVWIRDNVPPGVRSLVGLLLIVGGVFSFLPILGLWMLPLGVAVLLLDLKPLYHGLRRTFSRGNRPTGPMPRDDEKVSDREGR